MVLFGLIDFQKINLVGGRLETRYYSGLWTPRVLKRGDFNEF